MNAFRYYLALIGVLVVPSSVLMWLLVHPFIAFWRRLGVFWTYLFLILASWALAAGLFLVRHTLLAVDFGNHWLPLLAGIVTVIVAARLRAQLHRHFSARQLLGLPELAPDRFPPRLVTEGLHARVRHPRYLQFLLALAGWALIANFLAVYVLLVAMVPCIWLVVLLEERELRARFGPAYDDYCRRVPRFIPRRRA